MSGARGLSHDVRGGRVLVTDEALDDADLTAAQARAVLAETYGPLEDEQRDLDRCLTSWRAVYPERLG